MVETTRLIEVLAGAPEPVDDATDTDFHQKYRDWHQGPRSRLLAEAQGMVWVVLDRLLLAPGAPGPRYIVGRVPEGDTRRELAYIAKVCQTQGEAMSLCDQGNAAPLEDRHF